MKKLPPHIKKAPLFITTALLTLYPICLAELSLTSSDSASATELSAQQRFQIAQRTLTQSLPRTNLSSQLPASLPSLPQLQDLQSTLSAYRQQLAQLTPNVKDTQRLDPLISAINQLEALLQIATQAQTTYAQDLKNLATANALYEAAKSATLIATTTDTNNITAQQKAQDAYDAAVQDEALTLKNLNTATAAAQTAQQNYNSALAKLETATNNLTAKSNALEAATTSADKAKQDYQAALQTFNEASAARTAAQDRYQNPSPADFIPDPNFTPLTQQVAHTTYTTTGGLTAEVYNRSNYSSQPPLPTENETPYATLTVPNIDFQWGGGYILDTPLYDRVLVKFSGGFTPTKTGDYQFYAPGDDGIIAQLNGTTLINDWYDKGGGGSFSNTIHLEAGNTYPLTLYFYENGGGANVWLYYAIPSTGQGFQIVPSNLLGTITSSQTTYTTEVIPNQVIPTILDPQLLTNLQSAQEIYDAAAANLATASAATKEADVKAASASAEFDDATTNKEAASTAVDTALTTLNSANQDVNVNNKKHISAATQLSTSSSNLDAAKISTQTSQQNLTTATSNEASANTQFQAAQTKAQGTLDSYTATYNKATTKSSEVDILFSTIQPDPAPTPESNFSEFPTGSPEIPQNLSAENLMSVDLSKVDPTELTPEQAAQLQEAALQTFETATQGSPEYQQALDALYLAAEQDDIEVSPELAALPAIGPALEGAVKLLNLFGNAGADMSPKVRETTKKIVVAGVVAVGAAVASAVSATQTTTTSTRKLGK